MKRLIALAGLVLAGVGSMVVSAVTAAQQQPPVAEIQAVTDNVYVITGGGGNTAAFVTDAGVVVVDTKLANWGQAILDKIRTVTDKPVTTIINTHTHGDHTGSNGFFGATVERVAHVNTRDNMSRMPAFQGDGAALLPGQTFENRLTLGDGASRIDLYHFGPGHTNGDAFVVFTADRVMHAGDMFAGRNTPIIDTNNGGSALHYGRTLTGAAAVPGVDRIITGHSAVMAPADLRQYAEFNTWFATWAEAQKRAGLTVEEAAAAFEIPTAFEGYSVGNAFGGLRGNIQTAYDELSR